MIKIILFTISSFSSILTNIFVLFIIKEAHRLSKSKKKYYIYSLNWCWIVISICSICLFSVGIIESINYFYSIDPSSIDPPSDLSLYEISNEKITDKENLSLNEKKSMKISKWLIISLLGIIYFIKINI